LTANANVLSAADDDFLYLREARAGAIVSAHRGDIEVRSSSDQGTTFTVRLPKSGSKDSAS